MHEETDDAAAQSTLAYDQPRGVATPAADVGALALRLLGVKTVVDLLTQLATYLPFALTEGATSGVALWIGVIVQVGLQATLAVILIFAARPIAEAIFGRRTLAAHDLGVGAWMMLIVSGVGLALALFSLDEGTRGVMAIVARVQMNVAAAMPRAVELPELLSLLAPILKVGLGLLLFFRPSLLVTPWLRGASRDA